MTSTGEATEFGAPPNCATSVEGLWYFAKVGGLKEQPVTLQNGVLTRNDNKIAIFQGKSRGNPKFQWATPKSTSDPPQVHVCHQCVAYTQGWCVFPNSTMAFGRTSQFCAENEYPDYNPDYTPPTSASCTDTFQLFDNKGSPVVIISTSTATSKTTAVGGASMPSHAAHRSSPSSDTGKLIGAIVGGVLGGMVVLLLLFLIVYILLRRRRRRQRHRNSDERNLVRARESKETPTTVSPYDGEDTESNYGSPQCGEMPSPTMNIREFQAANSATIERSVTRPSMVGTEVYTCIIGSDEEQGVPKKIDADDIISPLEATRSVRHTFGFMSELQGDSARCELPGDTPARTHSRQNWVTSPSSRWSEGGSTPILISPRSMESQTLTSSEQTQCPGGLQNHPTILSLAEFYEDWQISSTIGTDITAAEGHDNPEYPGIHTEHDTVKDEGLKK